MWKCDTQQRGFDSLDLHDRDEDEGQFEAAEGEQTSANTDT